MIRVINHWHGLVAIQGNCTVKKKMAGHADVIREAAHLSNGITGDTLSMSPPASSPKMWIPE
jgi:hypothetical protein